MNQKVTVIYPTGSMSSGESVANYYREPKRMDLVIYTEGMNEGSLEKLERVYRYMNAVDGSEIESQLRSFRVRSMMVGDMVEMDGKTFICDSLGWKVIDHFMGIKSLSPGVAYKNRE